MMIVDLIVMLILSAASGCGLGGGGLLVVYLTLVKGTGQTVAQALNLLFYVLAALSSTASSIRRTPKDTFRTALFCSLCALPGAYIGSGVRDIAPDSILRAVFGVFLIIAGISVGASGIDKLRKKKMSDIEKSGR